MLSVRVLNAKRFVVLVDSVVGAMNVVNAPQCIFVCIVMALLLVVQEEVIFKKNYMNATVSLAPNVIKLLTETMEIIWKDGMNLIATSVSRKWRFYVSCKRQPHK